VIVVLGSRFDPLADSLVRALPAAALCSAEDLTLPGWMWPLGHGDANRWVVQGKVVDDREVTGVLVRRTWVYPEELVRTHPDDREYLAAESLAFLTFVLARTGARVINPVQGGAIGEEIFRIERWLPAAIDAGLEPRPLRLAARHAAAALDSPFTIEVVGGDAFGSPSSALATRSIAFVRLLGLAYAVLVFDAENRLAAISAASCPSSAALPALAALLSRRGPR
jgi:hypothetical protein